MHAPNDLELLQSYARDGSHDAFGQIVRRHVDLVYSAALRLTRDPHQAEDVAQTVFIRLAAKASALDERVILPGWLLNTTRNVAADARKSQARRHRHEHRAAEIRTMTTGSSSAQEDWKQIAPDLDDAIATLGETNRLAIVLRYFKGYTVSETAAQLGISDDAVKQRSSRGLEQLREFFLSRGVTTAGATALATAIAANAVHPAPPALASTAAAAVAGAIPTTVANLSATGAVFAKSKPIAAAVLIAAIGGGTTMAVLALLREKAPRPLPPPPAIATMNVAAPRPVLAAGRPAAPLGNTLIKGRVTTPDGTPVAAAEVTITSARTYVSVYRLFNFGAPVQITGADGTFEFQNQLAKSAVLVRCAKGYALTTPGDLAASPDVVVQPWGRIEGTLRAGNKPLANEVVSINRWGSGELFDWSQVDHTTTARTDAAGRFVFPTVAPGDAWVTHRVRLAPGDVRDSHHTHVEVLPGKTVTVEVGGKGLPVIGKVLLPDFELAGNTPLTPIHVHGVLWRQSEFHMPHPHDWHQMDPEQQRRYELQWRASPEGRAWSRSVGNYEFPVNPDGTFRVEDIRGGEYHMQLRVETRDPQTRKLKSLAVADRRISVPELDLAPNREPIDVGEVQTFPR